MLSRLIRQHARFCGIEVITHCVMSNHFHLLLRVPESRAVSDDELVQRMSAFYNRNSPYLTAVLEAYEENGELTEHLRQGVLSRMGDISVFMKELKQRFAKWYNKQCNRFGTLWAERFKSILVEDRASVLATVAAYIDLNPVRSGLVEDPKDYRWCGYAEAAVGLQDAREGFKSFHHFADWRSVAREYRKYLFIRAGVAGGIGKRVLDRETIRKVVKIASNVS
jgi:putative transposase